MNARRSNRSRGSGGRILGGLAVLVGLTLTTLAAEPPRLVLSGPATNTTGGDVTATVLLVLRVDGETVTGEMKTEPPLSGSGQLTGRIVGGWCELHGNLAEGFRIQFRGAINTKDFRGTYIAVVPGEPVQYGKFQLARQATDNGAPPL